MFLVPQQVEKCIKFKLYFELISKFKFLILMKTVSFTLDFRFYHGLQVRIVPYYHLEYDFTVTNKIIIMITFGHCITNIT